MTQSYEAVALHIAGAAAHGALWSTVRGTYILSATHGRTASSRECNARELVAAAEMVKAAAGAAVSIARQAQRYADTHVAEILAEVGAADWVIEYATHVADLREAKLWAEFWAQRDAEAAACDRATQVAREPDRSQFVYDSAGNLMFASPRY